MNLYMISARQKICQQAIAPDIHILPNEIVYDRNVRFKILSDSPDEAISIIKKENGYTIYENILIHEIKHDFKKGVVDYIILSVND